MRALRVALVLGALAVAALLCRPPGPAAPGRAAPRSSAPVPEEAPLRPPAEETATPPAAEEAEPVLEDAALVSVRWLLANQNADGSWGDGPFRLEGVEIGAAGLTSLALLCLLESGYSHLSKDEYDGRCIGVAVRKGLDRLLAEQGVDGLFPSARSGLDPALAAYALADAYGLTGSDLFKGPAQRAIDGLSRLQSRDGSWGDRPTTAWAAEALIAARAADLEVSTSVTGGLLGYYDRWRSSDAAELVARIQLERQLRHPAVAEGVARILAETPGWSLHQLYFRSRALRQYDCPEGPAWKAWKPVHRAALAVLPPLSGAGLSELTVRASLGELCAGFYHAYTNVFGPK